MIGSSDDDLLYELKQESAMEKLKKDGKKPEGAKEPPKPAAPVPIPPVEAPKKPEEHALPATAPPTVPLASVQAAAQDGRKAPSPVPAGGVSPGAKGAQPVNKDQKASMLFGKKQ